MDCLHPVQGDAGAERCQASALGVGFEVSLGGEGTAVGGHLAGRSSEVPLLGVLQVLLTLSALLSGLRTFGV